MTPTSFPIIQPINIAVVQRLMLHVLLKIKKKINSCHKLNYFVSVCQLVIRQNKIRQISSNISPRRRGEELGMTYSSGDEFVFSVWDTPAPITKALIVTVHINGMAIKFPVDISASMNILAKIDCDKMCTKLELQKYSVRIYASGSTLAFYVCRFFKTEIWFKDTRIRSTLNNVNATMSSSNTRLQMLLSAIIAQVLSSILLSIPPFTAIYQSSSFHYLRAKWQRFLVSKSNSILTTLFHQ